MAIYRMRMGQYAPLFILTASGLGLFSAILLFLWFPDSSPYTYLRFLPFIYLAIPLLLFWLVRQIRYELSPQGLHIRNPIRSIPLLFSDVDEFKKYSMGDLYASRIISTLSLKRHYISTGLGFETFLNKDPIVIHTLRKTALGTKISFVLNPENPDQFLAELRQWLPGKEVV